MESDIDKLEFHTSKASACVAACFGKRKVARVLPPSAVMKQYRQPAFISGVQS